MKKFYEFKNKSPSTADLFIYGEIVQEKSVDYWTGEESQTDVGLMDFKKELDDIGNVQKINLYINSPGGDVFTASTMISMLQRKKDAGTHIDAYVDGLSASAASFLMMVADNLYLYKNSTVMVHKPMSWAIDALNKIEENVMLPMYMNKSKVSEDEIRSLINDETWLSASDMDKYFNVTILNEEKVAVANIHSNLFKNYHNVPDFIKKSLKNEEKEQKKEKNSPKIDEKTLENDKKESISTENQSKEQEIKAKLGLIKSSLIIKKMKERNDVNE